MSNRGIKMCIRAIRELAKRTAGLRHDHRGASAVEFSLFSPMLLFLAIGCYDFSVGMYRQMQVNDAAEAGATYALSYGYSSSGVVAAITSATSYSAVTATPAPAQFCGCASGSSITTATSCSSVCSDGSQPGTYTTVNAAATYTPIFSYPGLPSAFSLSATATVRLQ
jgi:Flp pilus assembly protein TadG